MEKYSIVIVHPNIEFCMKDAEELKSCFDKHGIQSRCFRDGKYMYVKTNHGVTEFMPSDVLNDERSIRSHVTGKRYEMLFGLAFIPDYLKNYVRSYQPTGDYIHFIIEKEMEYNVFSGKACEFCKNFPICSIKEEYVKMQVTIDALIDGSEYFRKAKLECKYYTAKDPTYPCGCV